MEKEGKEVLLGQPVRQALGVAEVTAGLNAEPSAARCGTCRLYGANFYRGPALRYLDTVCCADAVMNLPASFIPNRQTMASDEGAGCIAWEPVAHKAEAS